MRNGLARSAAAGLIAVAAAIVLVGCRGDVLFQDSFDRANANWETGEFYEGIVTYGSGDYVVVSNGGGSMMWGRLTKRSFEDVAVEVQATVLVPPPNNNNSFGVGCRIRPNNDGYYLRISSDGFYAITRIADGTPVNLVEWTASPAIQQGAATNTIQVTCEGSSLALSVNGQPLASAMDTTFTSGDVALTATSFEATGTEIHFDNFVARRPDAEEQQVAGQ